MSRRLTQSMLLGAALMVAGLSTSVTPVLAQQAAPAVLSSVSTPKAQFGHDIGADYVLPNYTQLEAYWRKLDSESDRLALTEIGKTAEGRPQLMMIITSPENHRRLEHYREIAKRLALAEGLTDDQARALAKEGKAVVWIDGGLHSTETLGAQQLMETVYQLASRTDDETVRILNDVIILAVHANPDGMELVSDWYMRNPVPEERSTANLPELYQKHAGHDNNRDFYMAALPESENMNRILYREWMPQIVYNHHQTGPAGTVMFAPPFRDPFNHNFHPMIPATLDLVGSAMATRFLAEGKPGVTSRQGANYSTWWNGGLRTTPYFHNMIGILTETIGGPTPTSIPFVLGRQLPSSSLWSPIAPQRWHFRQSVDYSLTANYAILDLASRYRETFLLNIYQMGRDNIQRGNQDSWTPSPRRVAAVQAKMAEVGGAGRGGRAGGSAEVSSPYWADLHAPEHRDPRGFILSVDQPDFGTATRFMNALIKGGVTVHRATAAFAVNGKQYPANSYVVKSAQAFRPHVMDMFQPQDHPDDFPYEGGPPNRPYDSAGYTLAMQMGVEFDPILEAFDGPFERVADIATTPAGRIIGTQPATGYYFSHGSNDSFIAVNRLLKAGETVTWLADGPMGSGTFHVEAKPTTRALLERMAAELGVSFQIATAAPAGAGTVLRTPRIGLFDQYGGGMPSGWTRLVFENFEFPYTVVYPPTLDAGNLRDTFDILIFNGSGIPGLGGGGGGRGGGGGGANADIPAAFRDRQGAVTAATMTKIKEFVEGGGTVLTIGGASTNIAAHFDLPIQNHLTERNDAGEMASIPATKFYVPGSVLRATVDPAASITHGLPEELNVYFNNSPTFRLGPNATSGRVRTIAWFHTSTPLRSGWAWGQSYLQDGIAAYEAEVGKGRLYVFGPEITFRSQPHGTFKFLFNGILLSATEPFR
ncbi:MAG: M14 family metallopeptidase [Acidobacteria bacterium]|nr:M14 family metallopeptidase [Acidobacteriota bacterium]